VIILSWNRRQDILDTLEHLRLQTYRDYEVVVIDQASDDGTPEAVAQRFPEVRLVSLDRNLGVPGGRNVGVEHARGELLVFLDNDAFLEPEGLDKLVAKFDAEPAVGILGCRIENFFTGEMDHGSWVYPKNRKGDYEREFETYTFAGGGSAMRRRTFDEAGGYWADLFMYWEECDLSLRAMKAGHRLLYFPSVVVRHRTSPEKRLPTGRSLAMTLRNSLWTNWRSLPRVAALTSTVVRVSAYLVKGVRSGCAWAVICGAVGALSRIGLLWSDKHRLNAQQFARYRGLSDQGPWRERWRTLLRG
jgi:GT2 family glycosyltransferase